MTQENLNKQKRIALLFMENPLTKLRFSDVKRMTGFKDSAIKSSLRRLSNKLIIMRIQVGKNHSYALRDMHKAKRYINGAEGGEIVEKQGMDFLDGIIRQEKHHRFFQIKLTDEEWKKNEIYYTKPSENDRAKNSIHELGSFKIIISRKSLNGTIYLLAEDWESELKSLYPRLYFDVKRLEESESGHLGVSIDMDAWSKIRLNADDLRVVFAKSHFWKEIDAEGSEILVNSFLQNIIKTSFDKTTTEVVIAKSLERLNQTLSEQNLLLNQLLTSIRDLSEKEDK